MNSAYIGRVFCRRISTKQLFIDNYRHQLVSSLSAKLHQLQLRVTQLRILTNKVFIASSYGIHIIHREGFRRYNISIRRLHCLYRSRQFQCLSEETRGHQMIVKRTFRDQAKMPCIEIGSGIRCYSCFYLERILVIELIQHERYSVFYWLSMVSHILCSGSIGSFIYIQQDRNPILQIVVKACIQFTEDSADLRVGNKVARWSAQLIQCLVINMDLRIHIMQNSFSIFILGKLCRSGTLVSYQHVLRQTLSNPDTQCHGQFLRLLFRDIFIDQFMYDTMKMFLIPNIHPIFESRAIYICHVFSAANQIGTGSCLRAAGN